MFKASRNISVLCVVFAVCGCAPVAPSFTLKEFTPEGPGDVDGLIKFKLPQSVIVVSQNSDEKTNKVTPYLVVSVPVEAKNSEETQSQSESLETTYALVPADSFGVKTHVKATFRSNTQMFESIGTEIEDNRIKYVQAVGGVITGLIGMETQSLAEAPSSQGKPILPAALDVARTYLKEGNRGAITNKRDFLSNGWPYEVSIGPVPSDAIKRSEFVARMKESAQSVIFYSACREALFKFNDRKSENWFTTSLKIADPNFVQTIALPAKGKVDMHSACGVNTTSEAVTTASGLELLNTLIAQAKAIREAQKK